MCVQTNKQTFAIYNWFQTCARLEQSGSSMGGKYEDTMANQSKDGRKKEPLKDALSNGKRQIQTSTIDWWWKHTLLNKMKFASDSSALRWELFKICVILTTKY